MKIMKPAIHSEFECQAYLYNELLKRGVDVKGEVVWRSKVPGTNGRKEQARFDLVVFRGTEAVHIIEIKGDRKKDTSNWENTRQGIKYAKFNLKLSKVVGMKECQEFIKNWSTDD